MRFKIGVFLMIIGVIAAMIAVVLVENRSPGIYDWSFTVGSVLLSCVGGLLARKSCQ